MVLPDQAYFLTAFSIAPLALSRSSGTVDWVNLDAGIEREEPRFSDGRDVRSILHLEKNEPRALAVGVRKIKRPRASNLPEWT